MRDVYWVTHKTFETRRNGGSGVEIKSVKAMLSMATPDTWYAYFYVTGSFDPNDITRRIGVAPTYAVKEGEPGRVIKEAKWSRWELRSRLGVQESLELHVKDVLDQMDANKTAFQELSRELDGTMELVGYFLEQEPGIHFEKVIVARIAQYALSIDCDFYNYDRR